MTKINRRQYRREGLRYASDTTDELDGALHAGGPGVYVILYILVTGCEWRALPRDYPPLDRGGGTKIGAPAASRQAGPTPGAGRDSYFGPVPHPRRFRFPAPRALRSRPTARELRGRSAVGVAPLVVTA